MMEKKSRVDELCDELKKDMTLTDVNLREKALMCPAIKVKWVRILHEENRRLKQLKAADKQILDSAVRSNPTKPRFQCENELMMNQTGGSPGKLALVRTALEEQEQVVDLMKTVISVIIDKFGFEIGSCIKLVDAESR